MNVRWDIPNDCWVFKIVRLVNFPSSPVFRLPRPRPLGITSVIATRQWWCEASHDPAAPTVARHTEIRRSLVLMEHTWRMPSSVRIGEHFQKKWEVGMFWMVLIPLIVQKSCYHHLGCIKMLYQRVRIFLVFRFEWNRPVPFDWWVGNAKKWTEDSKATLVFLFPKNSPYFIPTFWTPVGWFLVVPGRMRSEFLLSALYVLYRLEGLPRLLVKGTAPISWAFYLRPSIFW